MKDKTNMKRFALIMAALAILVTGCGKGQKFTLKGDMQTANFKVAADSLILQSDGMPTVHVIPVKDGAFSFTGRVDRPSLATLKAPGETIETKHLILEKGTITFDHGLARGTPLNEAVFELNQQVREIMKENRQNPDVIPEKTFELFHDYLTKHPNDPSAVSALLIARHFTQPAKMSELIALTSKSIQKERHVEQLSLAIRQQRLKPVL